MASLSELLNKATGEEEDQEFLDFTPTIETQPKPTEKRVDVGFPLLEKHFGSVPTPGTLTEPTEVGKGLTKGAREAGQNILDLGYGISSGAMQLFGIQPPAEQGLQLPEVQEPSTTAGQIVAGITEIVLDTALFSKGAATLGNQLIKRLPTTVKPAPMKPTEFAPVTVGSIATTEVAIEPNDPNLANLIADFPAMKGVVTDLLATNPDDPEILNMLRHHLLDLGIGVSANEVFKWMGAGFKEITKQATNKVSDWATANKIDYEPMRKFEQAFDDQNTTFMQSASRTLAKFKRYGKDMLIYNLFDAKHGVALLAEQTKKLGYSRAWRGYQEAQLLSNTSSTIRESIYTGAPRWVGPNRDAIKFDGPSMKSIIETFEQTEGRDQVKNLFKYMAAERAKAINAKTGKGYPEILGVKGITSDAVDNWVAYGRANKNIQNATAQLQDFNNTILKFAEDSGIISAESKASILDTNAIFVPFYRVLEDESAFANTLKETTTAPARALKKRLTGVDIEKGELRIGNLLDNLQKNYASIIKASLENRAKQEIYDSLEYMGDIATEHWATKAPPRPEGFQVNRDALEKMLINKSGKDIDLSDIPDDFLTVFGWQRKFDKNSNIDIVFRNGKAEQWEIKDPFLLWAMNDITPKGVRKLEAPIKIAKEMLSIPKRVLTFGVTSDPSFFLGSNLLRDAVQAEVLSTSSKLGIPMLNVAQGVVGRLANNTKYHEFLGAGGGFGATVARAEQQAGLDPRIIRSYYNRPGLNASRIIDTPKKLYDNWENIVSAFENATRFNEFNRLIKEGYSQREAAFMARNVATDFSMHGGSNLVRFMTSTSPFLNAGLQGLYRSAREFTKPSFPGAKEATRKAAALKLIAWTVAPQIVDWYINKDNPNWQSLPEEVRLSNILIDAGDGNFFAIPTAFELGVIGSTVKGMLTEMSNTHGRLFTDEFVRFATETFRLNITPQVAAPLLDPIKGTGLAFNETFRGTPIVPRRFENVEDTQQFTPYTSEAARRAGQAMGVSPIKVEYMFNAYLGAMGTYANAVADALIRSSDEEIAERPASGYTNLPVARRLFIDLPYSLTIQERDTYKVLERATEVKSTFDTMMKNASDKVKSDALNYLLPEDDEEKAAEMRDMYGISDILRNQIQEYNSATNLQISEIIESDDSPEDKRTQLDEIENERAAFFDQVYNTLIEQEGINTFLGIKEEPLVPFVNRMTDQLDEALGIQRRQ